MQGSGVVALFHCAKRAVVRCETAAAQCEVAREQFCRTILVSKNGSRPLHRQYSIFNISDTVFHTILKEWYSEVYVHYASSLS